MRRLALAISLWLLVSPVSAGAQPMFTGLGDLPGGVYGSWALGVSGDGTVAVGRSHSGDLEAFRWTLAEGMQGLGDLPGGSFNSEANDASGDGSVVAGRGSAASGQLSFRWTASGGMVNIFDLSGGSAHSEAYATSGDGTVIVGVGTSGLGTEAFRWEQGQGSMQGLGFLPTGNPFSQAFGVSPDGSVVVGGASRRTAQGEHLEAFRWTQADGMQPLGLLPGAVGSSRAWDVSADHSVIVGSSNSPLGGSEAVRWVDGVIEGLGDLPGGAFSSRAFATSADGAVVVGDSITSLTGFSAFIWDEVNGIRDLRDVLVNQFEFDLTGWTLTSAMDISHDGLVIVGTGVNPDGASEGWIAVMPVECSDGLDNDGDGLVDFQADPGCRDAASVTESPQCQDGINNDPGGNIGEDDFIDFDGGLSALGYVTSAPDPQCEGKPWRDCEWPSCCGLGFELVLLLPGLMWLRRRPRN